MTNIVTGKTQYTPPSKDKLSFAPVADGTVLYKTVKKGKNGKPGSGRYYSSQEKHLFGKTGLLKTWGVFGEKEQQAAKTERENRRQAAATKLESDFFNRPVHGKGKPLAEWTDNLAERLYDIHVEGAYEKDTKALQGLMKKLGINDEDMNTILTCANLKNCPEEQKKERTLDMFSELITSQIKSISIDTPQYRRQTKASPDTVNPMINEGFYEKSEDWKSLNESSSNKISKGKSILEISVSESEIETSSENPSPRKNAASANHGENFTLKAFKVKTLGAFLNERKPWIKNIETALNSGDRVIKNTFFKKGEDGKESQFFYKKGRVLAKEKLQKDGSTKVVLSSSRQLTSEMILSHMGNKKAETRREDQETLGTKEGERWFFTQPVVVEDNELGTIRAKTVTLAQKLYDGTYKTSKKTPHWLTKALNDCENKPRHSAVKDIVEIIEERLMLSAHRKDDEHYNYTKTFKIEDLEQLKQKRQDLFGDGEIEKQLNLHLKPQKKGKTVKK